MKKSWQKVSVFLPLLCLFVPGKVFPVEYKQKIDQIITTLEQKYTVSFIYDSIPTASWPELGYQKIEDSGYKKLYQYIKMFAQEIDKYPSCLFEKIDLQYIVFVEALHYKRQYRAAIPDVYKEILFYDILQGRNDTMYEGVRDRDYMIHVIHHELHHMVEEELGENYYLQDTVWLAFNDTPFSYGDGGASYYTDMIKKHKKKLTIFKQRKLILNHPAPGLISTYAGSAIEEDKSEIFASLFVRWEIKRVNKLCKNDEAVRKKVLYLKSALSAVCNEMDEHYWETIK